MFIGARHLVGKGGRIRRRETERGREMERIGERERERDDRRKREIGRDSRG